VSQPPIWGVRVDMVDFSAVLLKTSPEDSIRNPNVERQIRWGFALRLHYC
jgi:hypothetical protein